jgi:hypothetical protein
LDRKQLLQRQGLFTEEHQKLEEKLPEILESTVMAPASPNMQPMLVERDDQFVVTPLGALALASGAKMVRTADPKIFTLDAGLLLPGPEFTKRLGWDAAIPFDLGEVKKYSARDPEAQYFLHQYFSAGGANWNDWTSVAHVGMIPVDQTATAALMAIHLRTMYDPFFEAPSAMKKQIQSLGKAEKRGARTPCSPDDWMAPKARRMMSFFKGN